MLTREERRFIESLLRDTPETLPDPTELPAAMVVSMDYSGQDSSLFVGLEKNRRYLNAGLQQRLTSEGGEISDWAKYTTETHQSPSGDFQVHFYMNERLGIVNYWNDYKVVYNGGGIHNTFQSVAP